MYLAGVSVRRVEDITEALWGSKASPSTISELIKKAYIYVDGIYLRRNWGGEYENVAIMVRLWSMKMVSKRFRHCRGHEREQSQLLSSFQWLRGCSLNGVKLIIGGKYPGMLEAVGEVFPNAKYQMCSQPHLAPR